MIRCLFAFKGLILLTLVGIFLQTQPSAAAIISVTQAEEDTKKQ